MRDGVAIFLIIHYVLNPFYRLYLIGREREPVTPLEVGCGLVVDLLFVCAVAYVWKSA